MEEDVFALAPFKLPPRKASGQHFVVTDQLAATALVSAMKEKRRIHRYENVPPLTEKRDVNNIETALPPPVKSQDLFGLVPFTNLAPGWSPDESSSGMFILFNRYFICSKI